MENVSFILSEINAAVQAIVPGAKVMLFGSRASGSATDESDWDILVLTKDKYSRTTRRIIQDKLFPLSIQYASFINLLLVDEQRWKTGGEYYSLRKNIGDNLILA